LNLANATAFSSLACILLRASGESTLDFQCDVASIAHAEPIIGVHLAVIVRAPVRPRAAEIVVPALNLWCGPRQARTMLDLRRRQQAYAFFRVYCRVLMHGMVDFYARWGMALEPHLQNVYVALRDGMPSRMILRDLDSTILDPLRIRPVARANGVRLALGTWKQMPDFATGGRRLAHAMMYGHLGQVMSCLARDAQADLARLSAAVRRDMGRAHRSSTVGSLPGARARLAQAGGHCRGCPMAPDHEGRPHNLPLITPQESANAPPRCARRRTASCLCPAQGRCWS
jgi:Ferric iron reductase FhuF-like transporter